MRRGPSPTRFDQCLFPFVVRAPALSRRRPGGPVLSRPIAPSHLCRAARSFLLGRFRRDNAVIFQRLLFDGVLRRWCFSRFRRSGPGSESARFSPAMPALAGSDLDVEGAPGAAPSKGEGNQVLFSTVPRSSCCARSSSRHPDPTWRVPSRLGIVHGPPTASSHVHRCRGTRTGMDATRVPGSPRSANCRNHVSYYMDCRYPEIKTKYSPPGTRPPPGC